MRPIVNKVSIRVDRIRLGQVSLYQSYYIGHLTFILVAHVLDISTWRFVKGDSWLGWIQTQTCLEQLLQGLSRWLLLFIIVVELTIRAILACICRIQWGYHLIRPMNTESRPNIVHFHQTTRRWFVNTTKSSFQAPSVEQMTRTRKTQMNCFLKITVFKYFIWLKIILLFVIQQCNANNEFWFVWQKKCYLNGFGLL